MIDETENVWYYLLRHVSVFYLEILKVGGEMKNFLIDVKNELKKVRWLNKKEMTKYSIATVAFILIFSIFFGGLDLILAGIKSIIK